MEKTFKQKNFNNFIWTPLGSRVNIYINFCLQVPFMVSAAWYCCHYFPPATLTPVANLPPVSTTLAKMVEKICHRCRWYRWCTLTREYLRKFSKKIWNGLNGILWGWGETDAWKNQKQKISWHCPFKSIFVAVFRPIKKRKKHRNFVEYSLWRWGSVRMKDSKAHVLTKTYIKMPFQLWPKIYYIFPHRSTISAAEYFLKELYINP